MEKLTTVEIRKRFLEHFIKNKHLTISASSLLPKNDPTLLFINSGMAPLKNYFLGKEEPPSKRMANFQPCIRTKDIDDVGDRHHLTLFEMMGSWSIGDYYKNEACALAYDLLVKGLGFNPEKLYMTVYGGNKSLGIAADTESIDAWVKCGVKKDHIVVLGDDNFWGPAGAVGPCGPCTEVFYDTGEEFGPKYTPGGHFDDVGRYIEIWNAGVFMELDKQKDGSFKDLPFKSVDTGSGLERMAMVMNGFESVYETDLMAPLVEIAIKLYGEVKSETDKTKIRMISDHMRAATMILSEGVLPSNEGQGYIPRRLIRKVIASLISVNCKNIDFTEMVNKVIELQAPYYPRMEASRDLIFYNLNKELNDFLPVVTEGLRKIDEEVKLNHKAQGKLFSGKLSFELVTTFGLPLEVILSDLGDRGIELDRKEYDNSYDEHRKTSRVISRKDGITTDIEKLKDLLSTESDSKFVGYTDRHTETTVLKLIRENQFVEEINEVSTKFYFTSMTTPFYAESGGQVGDSGKMVNDHSEVLVLDTIKVGNIHLHLGELVKGKISLDSKWQLSVDVKIRKNIARNHTATHLLHAALHKIVGKHAVQKGSSVRANSLRFDFVHQKPLTSEELIKVESMVNELILNGISQKTEVLPYDDALKKGAMALFGEKYDSDVRMVSFGEDSVELCGGTHVDSTSEIGTFIIKSQSSVAKGIRRIEAVTGSSSYELIQKRNTELKNLSSLLSVKSCELEDKVNELIQKAKTPKKEKKIISSSEIKYIDSFSKKINEEVSFFMGLTDCPVESLKDIGDKMIDKGDYNIICLMSTFDESLKAFCWVKKPLVSSYKAGSILKDVLAIVGGKGGGRPNFAQGGAPHSSKINLIVSEFKENMPHYFVNS